MLNSELIDAARCDTATVSVPRCLSNTNADTTGNRPKSNRGLFGDVKRLNNEKLNAKQTFLIGGCLFLSC